MNHSNDWHLLEGEKAAEALDTDLYKGLTDREVRRRRRITGPNNIWHIPRISPFEAVIAAVFDLATLLLMISAAAAALFDKSTEAGALIVLLLIGGAVRTAAHLYACRILENRAKDKIPSVSVLRDGRVKLMSAEEIVPGDIVLLEAGDTVPCDGRVVSGEDSVVSERDITENKNPVHKFDNVIETEAAEEVPCEFRSNMLFAGSLVLSGSLRMAATATGEATLISRKQGGITIDAAVKLPAVEKLRVRSRNTSLVMLACVMILTALSIFFGEVVTLPDVFLGTMAMAVAAMSEFLTVIATITIAVGVRDAAQRKGQRILVRRPEKLEDIRDIRRIVFCGSSFFKSGRSELYACRVKGEYARSDDMNEDQLKSAEEMISLALTASADSNTGIASGHFGELNNTDMDAVIRRAAYSIAQKSGKKTNHSWTLYDHLDADDNRTAGLQLSLIEYKGDVFAVGVGSPSDVLACCSTAETADGDEPLTAEMRRTILTECARLEFGGASVLAVAVRRSPYMQLNRAAVLTQYMTFTGFFSVAEEPEEGAKQHIAEFRKNGIVPIIFTDKPDADLYYCHRLGMFNKNTVRVNAQNLTEDVVDAIGAEGAVVSFEGISHAHMASAYSKAMKTVMYNRVTGTDKILQDADEAAPVTAAVGRETRDSGVTAAADVGFAVSRSDMRTIPTTLSAQAAVIVHRESRKSVEAGFGGFDGVTDAMNAASVMFSNMEAAKSYLTASQCARLVVLFASVVFGIPLLSAVFILIWGLLFDFAAILMMAFASPGGVHSRIGTVSRNLHPIIDGLVWGSSAAGWCALLPIFAELIGFTLASHETAAILASSTILSGAVCAFTSLKREYRGCRLNLPTAGVLFFAAAAVLAAILVLTDLYAAGAAYCGVRALFALVPPLVPICIFGVDSLARRMKDNR